MGKIGICQFAYFLHSMFRLLMPCQHVTASREGSAVRPCTESIACSSASFLLILWGVLFGLCNPLIAQSTNTASEVISYSFCSSNDCTDGKTPVASAIQAADGNYYGTTLAGGANNFGSIYKMTPNGTLATVYSFTGAGDGGFPASALIQGSDGDLYGTTIGTYSGTTSGAQFGTIFKLTTSGTLTTLYTFGSSANTGSYPQPALVQGSDGSFYGVAPGGGSSSTPGFVYKITSAGSLTTLYTFCNATNCTDGYEPTGTLVQGTDGNFYGVTYWGGSGVSASGTVFRISSSGSFTSLYSFCKTQSSDCTDGTNPQGGLVQAADGNLYGSTVNGGGFTGVVDGGTFFRITPSGTLTTLVDGFFCAGTGCYPSNTFTLGSDGNLYSVFNNGGNEGPYILGGTFYELTTTGGFQVLYNFCSQANCADGEIPVGSPIQGNDGNFYGTASSRLNSSPADYTGVLYQLVPAAALQAPVQLSFHASNVASGTPDTLTWKVLNAYSTSMEQCYAFVQGGATGARGRACNSALRATVFIPVRPQSPQQRTEPIPTRLPAAASSLDLPLSRSPHWLPCRSQPHL